MWALVPENVSQWGLQTNLPPEIAEAFVHAKSRKRARDGSDDDDDDDGMGGVWIPPVPVRTLDEDEARFKPGTVKAVCFSVLKAAGTNGLSVADIINVSQAQGLKDWTAVNTPKNTVAAACSQVGCPSRF